jgi:hypothetical protein
MAGEEYAPRPTRPLATEELPGGWRMKVYCMNVEGAPEPEHALVSAALDEAARMLPSPQGALGEGFLLVHRARPANFVLVNWWEGVDLRHLYYSSPHRRPQHLSQLQRPAFACVWELDVLLHEQQARIRHVLAVNPPQTGDYLADLYVWPPKD